MGIIQMGPPKALILALAKEHRLAEFIETGTYRGNTAQWAARHFDRVHTIENSRVIFEKTAVQLRTVANVDFRYGDSRIQLEAIVSDLKSSAVIWLDSHWCGGESYGENDQCPLLEEIAIINRVPTEHFVFIDDARLFLSPPPLPNTIDAWPTVSQIIQLLNQGRYQRYVVVVEDVIIAVPLSARLAVAQWCQQVNTTAWEEHGSTCQKAAVPSIQGGAREIFHGMGSICGGLMRQVRRPFSPQGEKA